LIFLLVEEIVFHAVAQSPGICARLIDQWGRVVFIDASLHAMIGMKHIGEENVRAADAVKSSHRKT
jgi:hypothetical protein